MWWYGSNLMTENRVLNENIALGESLLVIYLSSRIEWNFGVVRSKIGHTWYYVWKPCLSLNFSTKEGGNYLLQDKFVCIHQ